MRPHLIAAIALSLAAAGGMQAAAQSTAPIEDGGKFYCVIFTSDAWKSRPAEAALIDWIERPPADGPLEPWVRRCRLKHLRPSDPIYRDRFARYMPPERLPAIWIQRPDGGVVYCASGENLPGSSYQLGREIEYFAGLDPAPTGSDSAAIHGRIEWMGIDGGYPCPDGRCPPSQPPSVPGTGVGRDWPLVDAVFPDSVDLMPVSVPGIGRTVLLVAAGFLVIIALLGGGLLVIVAIALGVWALRKD